MIDYLYALYSRHKQESLNPDYSPRKAIKGRKLLNKEADKLAVIFPGWHTHSFPVNILANRLVKKGWAVLVYDFDDQIIMANEEMVENSFRYLRDTIAQDINNLLSGKSYEQVHLIGISLGNVVLALVTDKFSKFTSSTLVVAGDSLAIDMWHGARTIDYRADFEKLHIGVRKLSRDWSDESPINHLRHFAGKRVKLVMSTNDKFVRTKYQKKLAAQMVRVNADTQVKKRFSGHVVTIIRFCLFDSPL